MERFYRQITLKLYFTYTILYLYTKSHARTFHQTTFPSGEKKEWVMVVRRKGCYTQPFPISGPWYTKSKGKFRAHSYTTMGYVLSATLALLQRSVQGNTLQCTHTHTHTHTHTLCSSCCLQSYVWSQLQLYEASAHSNPHPIKQLVEGSHEGKVWLPYPRPKHTHVFNKIDSGLHTDFDCHTHRQEQGFVHTNY